MEEKKERRIEQFNNDLPDDLDLNEEFKGASKLMEDSDQSGLITGRAGVGKSTLLKYFRATTKKNVVVLASTGIAAINIHGQTIHSFFGLPWGLLEKKDVHKRHRMNGTFANLDAVVIDEVSMVRADLMDSVDYALRLNMNQDLPFGGIQVIFFGDLFQLPPVIKGKELHRYFEQRYGGPYFFNADIFDKIRPKCIELTKIYRQTDEKFIELLDKIRYRKVTEKDLNILNQRVAKVPEEEGCNHYVTLTTTNELAKGINERRLAKLRDKEYQYEAIIEGKFDETSYPTEYYLKLKRRAQVMLIRNDVNKQWVNGTLAEIEDISEDHIKVSIGTKICEVSKETWEEFEYVFNDQTGKIEKEIIGTFEQYPLKLAWAITIHKSQGHTFDDVIVDLGNGAFTHGQVYVALSRCRTFDGIFLKQPVRYSDIIFDKRVYGYINKFI